MHDDEPLTEQEMEAESMISLMQEMKRMQVASKDNVLSDEDRRQKAEDMIMKIAAMMDLGDDDDGEEGDPEEWEKLKAASTQETK